MSSPDQPPKGAMYDKLQALAAQGKIPAPEVAPAAQAVAPSETSSSAAESIPFDSKTARAQAEQDYYDLADAIREAKVEPNDLTVEWGEARKARATMNKVLDDYDKATDPDERARLEGRFKKMSDRFKTEISSAAGSATEAYLADHGPRTLTPLAERPHSEKVAKVEKTGPKSLYEQTTDAFAQLEKGLSEEDRSSPAYAGLKDRIAALEGKTDQKDFEDVWNDFDAIREARQKAKQRVKASRAGGTTAPKEAESKTALGAEPTVATGRDASEEKPASGFWSGAGTKAEWIPERQAELEKYLEATKAGENSTVESNLEFIRSKVHLDELTQNVLDGVPGSMQELENFTNKILPEEKQKEFLDANRQVNEAAQRTRTAERKAEKKGESKPAKQKRGATASGGDFDDPYEQAQMRARLAAEAGAPAEEVIENVPPMDPVAREAAEEKLQNAVSDFEFWQKNAPPVDTTVGKPSAPEVPPAKKMDPEELAAWNQRAIGNAETPPAPERKTGLWNAIKWLSGAEPPATKEYIPASQTMSKEAWDALPAPEKARRAMEQLKGQEKPLDARAEKIGQKGLFRRIGDWYNKIPPKYKLAVGISLMGLGLAAGAGMLPFWLAAALPVAGGAWRATAGVGTYFSVEGMAQLSKKESGTRWYNKYPKAYGAIAGALLGGGSYMIAGGEALAHSHWLGDMLGHNIPQTTPPNTGPSPFPFQLSDQPPPLSSDGSIPFGSQSFQPGPGFGHIPSPLDGGPVANPLDSLSAVASSGHGYEYMLKHGVLDQLKGMHLNPADYPPDSDIHQLLTADTAGGHSIDKVVQDIAAKNHFFHGAGEGALAERSDLVQPDSTITAGPDGQLLFSQGGHAPAVPSLADNAPTTAPYHPGAGHEEALKAVKARLADHAAGTTGFVPASPEATPVAPTNPESIMGQQDAPYGLEVHHLADGFPVDQSIADRFTDANGNDVIFGGTLDQRYDLATDWITKAHALYPDKDISVYFESTDGANHHLTKAFWDAGTNSIQRVNEAMDPSLQKLHIPTINSLTNHVPPGTY